MSHIARIIIPYFGKLPKNIITFLVSCKRNRKISWIIFTNDKLGYKLNGLCENVLFVHSNMNEMRRRLVTVTGISNINLSKPYKLCDYKPVYGRMFADYLKGYKYWGYSDIDVVYGNLWKYIKNGVLHNYEKIGQFGHFTLIHNDSFMNNLYKKPILKDNRKVYLFNNIVSHTSRGCGFDEGSGINIICHQNHISTYCNPRLVNEIIFPDLDLNTLNKYLYKSKWQCYAWYKGKAIFFYSYKGTIKKREYGYFHFQKRTVFNHFIYDSHISLFFIVTHGYLEMNKLTNASVKTAMRLNKSPFIKRFKYKLHFYLFTKCFATRMHIGKIQIPLKYILINLFNKNFRIFKV